jgi:hypothetical protein
MPDPNGKNCKGGEIKDNSAGDTEEEEKEFGGSEEGDDDSDDEKTNGVPGQKLQAKWEQMYERLIVFKDKHGHCLVPNRYAEDAQLGSWGKNCCH